MNILRTISDLLFLPTQALMCERCSAWAWPIGPWQRIRQAVTGRIPCSCGGTLQRVGGVRQP